MPALPTIAVIPLFTDPQGAIRISGTQVLLDTIATAFRAGATAEGITQRFPTVAREIEKRFDPIGIRARLLARRNIEHADK
jgi:hypothetical protein